MLRYNSAMSANDLEKRRQIMKGIQTLDLDKKEHICKILLTYEVNVKQTNNGAYCQFHEISDELLDIIYQYIITNLK